MKAEPRRLPHLSGGTQDSRPHQLSTRQGQRGKAVARCSAIDIVAPESSKTDADVSVQGSLNSW